MSMSTLYHVNIIPCLHYTMSTLYHVYIIPCLHYTMSTLYHVYIIPCLHYTMSTLYHVYIIPCLHYTMSTLYAWYVEIHVKLKFTKDGSNKLLLPTQSTCNALCVCGLYACYKINMFKPSSRNGILQ